MDKSMDGWMDKAIDGWNKEMRKKYRKGRIRKEAQIEHGLHKGERKWRK